MSCVECCVPMFSALFRLESQFVRYFGRGPP